MLCLIWVCKSMVVVMILIVCGMFEEWVWGFDLGVDDYLIKFFDIGEFEVCIWLLLCW